MARELAPAGQRSGPKILGALRTGAPTRSSGSKLPRHKNLQALAKPTAVRCIPIKPGSASILPSQARTCG
ncbi:hypothetical protein DCC84_22005 [Pseudomonas sp. SXM-1]|nr:hypothetical protein DCC84_22005 [Pseudomonas sp. SXM-1]